LSAFAWKSIPSKKLPIIARPVRGSFIRKRRAKKNHLIKRGIMNPATKRIAIARRLVLK
jgi:hypothetical protein